MGIHHASIFGKTGHVLRPSTRPFHQCNESEPHGAVGSAARQDIVWQAFKIFDSDGSGTVTKAELLKLLTTGRSDKAKHEKESKTIEATASTDLEGGVERKCGHLVR